MTITARSNPINVFKQDARSEGRFARSNKFRATRKSTFRRCELYPPTAGELQECESSRLLPGSFRELQ